VKTFCLCDVATFACHCEIWPGHGDSWSYRHTSQITSATGNPGEVASETEFRWLGRVSELFGRRGRDPTPWGYTAMGYTGGGACSRAIELVRSAVLVNEDRVTAN